MPLPCNGIDISNQEWEIPNLQPVAFKMGEGPVNHMLGFYLPSLEVY